MRVGPPLEAAPRSAGSSAGRQQVGPTGGTMSIKRSEVMHRAATIWPLYGVEYSQGLLRNGWRTDCSGYVSMCLDLTGVGWGGANTETFVTLGYIHEITRDELRPGGHGWPLRAGHRGRRRAHRVVRSV